VLSLNSQHYFTAAYRHKNCHMRFLLWRFIGVVGKGLLVTEVSPSRTHYTRQDSSGGVIGPSQRIIPDNAQHSLQTDTHAPGGIRTHNPSKREAAEPHLRLRGHWDRLTKCYKIEKILIWTSCVLLTAFVCFLGPLRCWIISTSFKGREDETSPADFDLSW